MRRYMSLVLCVVLAACATPAGTSTPPVPTVAPSTQGGSAATGLPAASQAASQTPAPARTATAAPQATATALANTAVSATATAPASTAAVTATVAAGSVDPARYAFMAVAEGFHAPLLVTPAGDGTGRLFVVEQGGTIRIVKDGAVLPQPFLDITSLVTHGGSEQGLLGLAFDPHYAQSGQFYVDYTDVNGNTHLVRYRLSAADPNQADPASAQDLLQVDQPFPNHNGGNVVFGPDGYLYVSLGDGGSGGDPNGNGQNRSVLLGKLLRLDVSGGGAKYSIPPSNPFVGQNGMRPEIWAYGLRNPWRATFDRSTGDLWIADVGQDTYEEIDFQPAGDKGGEDYGWSYMEGLHPYKGQPPAGLSLVPPVAEYSHQEGGCSVTGGYIYRGPSLPELNGIYFLGDFCSGMTWTLTRAGNQWQRALFQSTKFQISSFGTDEAGELYVCDYGGGAVYKLGRAQ